MWHHLLEESNILNSYGSYHQHPLPPYPPPRPIILPLNPSYLLNLIHHCAQCTRVQISGPKMNLRY